ncbi:MAG TPA: MarR family winged helix-turn-helix transcriptional regulator [Candidatus Saccharimonadales bacterium]|jgi:DNA-binding MarR family transcriptional regulator|nr:MarR family winged helix-turn-helix transcriptional regulator [Candidatus Saccharimonadales bacterium]
MHKIQLPEDYALVLQQVEENGSEDFSMLAESLRIDRPRLRHIVRALQHKGLIVMQAAGGDFRIRLSAKGQQLTAYIWPQHGWSAI